jgi:nitrogen regulatory protein P-II 1
VLRDSGLCDISNGIGCYNLTVSTVQRLFAGAEPSQQRYSVELAESVIAEIKLELICDDNLSDQLQQLTATVNCAGGTSGHRVGIRERH